MLPAIMEPADNNPTKQTQPQTNKPIISALVFQDTVITVRSDGKEGVAFAAVWEAKKG